MHRIALLALTFVLFFSITSFAQPEDPGIPDTVRVETVQVDPLPSSPVVFNMRVTLYNDDSIGGASLGFYYNSDDVTIDSVSLAGGVAQGLVNQSYANPFLKLAVVGFYWLPGLPLVEPGDSLLANLWFTLAPGAPDQTVLIDSGFFPPAGDFILTLKTGESLKPQFKAGPIIVGEGTPPEPVIGLNPTSFTFDGVAGGSNPQQQTLNITNVGEGSLNWTASWNSSWLSVYPTSGTAPSNPAVSVNIFGLGAGTYNDTIVINAPGAPNSPLAVPVTLNLINPPPVIQLVPNSFYFIAVQDGANPANQQMTINDIGGGSLAWTATNSSGWLSLSSYSGGPGETIDLLVDITGLTYGDYYDTIVVSDPEASNSPRRAVVMLELVSSFPVLEVSPASFNVPGSVTEDPPDRILKVINGGGGTLDYSITSSKPWMVFTPQSGSTPDTQEVAVSFLSTGLDLGYTYDTIVVTSSNGSESPQTIPVLLWVMEDPPALGVSTSQLNFTGFECYNNPAIPPQTFDITNAAFDDMDWTLTWNADWLSVSPTSGLNAQTIMVSVNGLGLPLGSYVDTIWIDAVWSTTPAQMVEVNFDIVSSVLQPELTVSPTYIEFTFLAGYVGIASLDKVVVKNGVSGCMDWYLTDQYPWFTYLPVSGTDSTTVKTYVNGGGLPLGITPGEFYVHAPGALNDSILVNFNVYLAQIGDANCDGLINISDCVHMLGYIFIGGPPPIPRVWAGDVNCDFTCNVEDVVYLINYIFGLGPRPCQYKPFGLNEVQEMTPELEELFK